MIMELRVMPEDGEVEYSTLEEQVKKTVLNYGEGIEIKNIEPENIGFGLQAVKIKFQMNEDLGSDNLEENLNNLDTVGGVTVTLMDRL